MIRQIPIDAIPGQEFSTILNSQSCTIRLVQRLGRLYCDLQNTGISIFRGLICHDRTPIMQHKNLNFVGNLMFVDFDSTSDPMYTGLNSRFRFFYITDDVGLPEDFQIRGTEHK